VLRSWQAYSVQEQLVYDSNRLNEEDGEPLSYPQYKHLQTVEQNCEEIEERARVSFLGPFGLTRSKTPCEEDEDLLDEDEYLDQGDFGTGQFSFSLPPRPLLHWFDPVSQNVSM
jgi:hypothetical protein|tara:strand:- start:211 stop:552 length:342 start_codon:yes stop_codon:yes gene_type:complete